MTRGTTPTYTFVLEDADIDLGLARSVYVTFRQGRRMLRLDGDALTVSGHTVAVTLNQAQTLGFFAGQEPVLAQLNWVYDDGSRSASEIARLLPSETLEPEVLA